MSRISVPYRVLLLEGLDVIVSDDNPFTSGLPRPVPVYTALQLRARLFHLKDRRAIPLSYEKIYLPATNVPVGKDNGVLRTCIKSVNQQRKKLALGGVGQRRAYQYIDRRDSLL